MYGEESRLKLFEMKELVGEFVPDKYYSKQQSHGVILAAKMSC